MYRKMRTENAKKTLNCSWIAGSCQRTCQRAAHSAVKTYCRRETAHRSASYLKRSVRKIYYWQYSSSAVLSSKRSERAIYCVA